MYITFYTYLVFLFTDFFHVYTKNVLNLCAYLCMYLKSFFLTNYNKITHSYNVMSEENLQPFEIIQQDRKQVCIRVTEMFTRTYAVWTTSSRRSINDAVVV